MLNDKPVTPTSGKCQGPIIRSEQHFTAFLLISLFKTILARLFLGPTNQSAKPKDLKTVFLSFYWRVILLIAIFFFFSSSFLWLAFTIPNISTYIDLKEGLEQFLRPRSNVQFLSNVVILILISKIYRSQSLGLGLSHVIEVPHRAFTEAFFLATIQV